MPFLRLRNLFRRWKMRRAEKRAKIKSAKTLRAAKFLKSSRIIQPLEPTQSSLNKSPAAPPRIYRALRHAPADGFIYDSYLHISHHRPRISSPAALTPSAPTPLSDLIIALSSTPTPQPISQPTPQPTPATSWPVSPSPIAQPTHTTTLQSSPNPTPTYQPAYYFPDPPQLSAHPTRADLINAESRLGSMIFGPIPIGHRREFFHDRNNIWIWYEDWTDSAACPHQMTIRYEVRTSGIFKKVAAGRYLRLEGEELSNFRKAAHAYLKIIKRELYRPFAPDIV